MLNQKQSKWIGAKYLSMSDVLLKKKSKQKQNVNTWKY